MLAKQAWRILTHLDALLSKVLKARYFQNADFMEANTTPSSSFIWRSIQWGKLLLSRGIRWRVANGEKIRVLYDPWVSDIASGLPPMKAQIEDNARVSNLMTVEKRWDRDKVEAVFHPFVVVDVLKIPIDVNRNFDSCFWKYTEMGHYSVKSGYLLEIGYYNPPENCVSNDGNEWKHLVWSLQIPPKVKKILWRLLNDFIPTELNLLSHHVPSSGICFLCGADFASSPHSLFFCKSTRGIWKKSEFWRWLRECVAFSMMDIGRFLRHSLGKREYEIWVMAVWTCWREICEAKHGGKHICDDMVERGKHYLVAFQEAQRNLRVSFSFGVQLGDKSWHPPNQGIFCMDVDAAVDFTRKSFGVGAMVRDSCGKLMAAISLKIPYPESVMSAEISAAIHGVNFCFLEHIMPIVIFSNSVLAVKVLAGECNIPEMLDPVTRETLDVAHKSIIYDVKHLYRSANHVAHRLAKLASGNGADYTWTSGFPGWLQSMALSDLST